MADYFLGADLGGTKTHALITNSAGHCLGWGQGGPGNHEVAGYAAMQQNLSRAVDQALHSAGVDLSEIKGAGFGIGGYDFPSEKRPSLEVVNSLGLNCPVEIVNDVELGLLAGSPNAWGVAVVAGTGCNCRGWDQQRARFGRVTGGGMLFGENAGAAELIVRTQQALGHAWTGRGPATALTRVFCQHFSVNNEEELFQGLICHDFEITPEDVRLVFNAAREGDQVAGDLVVWAGQELGQMALCVIRQLNFQPEAFDLVLIGSMWKGSPVLVNEFSRLVYATAPKANILRFAEPPVIGAVVLGMLAANAPVTAQIRGELIHSVHQYI